jgi:hypothetical protein
MKVAKNLVFKIEIEIEIIEIHAILKLKLKLNYSKQSKFKSNWPHISVIEIAIEIEIHFKIEITLHVSAAFGKIFADRTPNMLQTDRGLEFLNAQVQEVFRKNNVHHYYSLNDDIKAALVERLNRTLKSRLYRYMTHHRTNRWIDALDDVVESYNASYHRSIGTAPDDVTSGNEEEIARRLYPPKPPLRYNYDVGDRVRI